MRNILLTVHQHGGDDVTCKPRIVSEVEFARFLIPLNKLNEAKKNVFLPNSWVFFDVIMHKIRVLIAMIDSCL
jgi:hypothetical protein